MEKIEIFDAIVGWDGAAAVSDWETMSANELKEVAEAQHENFYAEIELRNGDLDLIVDACVRCRDTLTQNEAYYLREDLREKFTGCQKWRIRLDND